MSGVQPLNPEQALGVLPDGNAWMSASAGTGKTQVLTARILRLLLAGTRPEAILAITFTKAGAAEMARRIRDTLALWVRMKDSDLSKQLFAILAPRHFDPDMLAHARSLFAEVIEAPGRGLAIQTIHGFCQSLLASFPEEAGLAPGFRPLEDRQQAMVQDEVLDDLLANDVAHGEPRFAARVEAMALALGEEATVAYLKRCAGAVETLEALPRGEGLGRWLRELFELPNGEPLVWLERQCADGQFDRVGLQAAIGACRAWGTKTGDGHANAIGNWLASDGAARAATIGALLKVFLTAEGTLRKDFATGKLSSVGDNAQRLADHFGAMAQTARAMAACERMAEALAAGRSFARAYAEKKRVEGRVDFDDLIRAAVALLAGPGRAEWIRYKLDSRIDHILVDEAQDTNRAQWQIVESLAEEYFAGAGVTDPTFRTLFVVGDFKQAIYGFQGTSPINFERARDRFFELGRAGERAFANLGIATNYRSSPPILALVDRVIDQMGPAALGLGPEPVRHSAFAERAGGRVVLWPPEPASRDSEEEGETEGEEGWIDSATRRVADNIARSVRRWIDDGIDGEEVRAGDIMVLVRRRTDLAGLVVSRLQSVGVAVAGVDRLKLAEPLAVNDLLAAARFALQPLDDLNCACLLTSPLIGWSHDELIAHGWRMDEEGKQRKPLWPWLRDQEGLRGRLQPLRDILNLGGYATPYRFFEAILSGPLQGRARLIARLGEAARDPIEALLAEALAYETRESGSLHQFLRWFGQGEAEVKREADSAADEVRVMTVHGSKGLQSKIVILADATGNPDRSRPRGVTLELSDTVKLPLLRPGKDERPALLAESIDEAEAEEKREHWRLLYVALTRAERMLFIGGALAKGDKGEAAANSWYAAVAPAVAALGGVLADDPHGVWLPSVQLVAASREDKRSEQKPVAATVPVDVPDWARAPAPDEPRPLRPLAPSSLGEAEALAEPQPPLLLGDPRAALRGTLMHALFERLPATTPDRRATAGAAWLATQGQEFDETARALMLASVLAVLDDPAHAALFGAGSLAEVPFSALVEGRVIAGSIDRLLVSDDAVRVIDYKTGANVPVDAAAVPLGYLKQMAAYAAALAVIFPDRRVDAALLFTGGPRLIDLPGELLDHYVPSSLQHPQIRSS